MIAGIKQQIKEFKLDVIDRVDWPKPDKVRSATVAVVLVSVFTGVYLWVCDLGFSSLLQQFFPKH